MATPPTYGSHVSSGQLYGVGEQYMFAPGLAVGPTLRGIGSAPPLTIPQGIGGGATQMETMNPLASVTAQAPALNMRTGLVLALMFAVGYFILAKVHWRA